MKRITMLITVFLCTFSFIQAQSVITALELAKIINQKDVVVVSARKASDYAKVHIKGAVNVDISTLQTNTPVEGILKSTDELVGILSSKGITPDKTVVLYCKSGVSAGRLFWILKYLGYPNVKMLDGQMGAWRAARKPVTAAPPQIKEATFTPQVNKNILADKSYVKSKISSTSCIIVDARKTEDYSAGHIDNAVNVSYKDLMTEDYKFKSNTEMKAAFEKAGVTSDKEVILYCKTGTTAGLLYFILTESLGYTKVKLYDGSYNEWTI